MPGLLSMSDAAIVVTNPVTLTFPDGTTSSSTAVAVSSLEQHKTKVYTDREYVLDGIPNYHDDCAFIPTANGKNMGNFLGERTGSEEAVSFTVSAAATVFVDLWYPDRQETADFGTWTSSWTEVNDKKGLAVRADSPSNGSPLSAGAVYGPGKVFSGDFNSEAAVSLKGIGTPFSSYLVWVCPQGQTNGTTAGDWIAEPTAEGSAISDWSIGAANGMGAAAYPLIFTVIFFVALSSL